MRWSLLVALILISFLVVSPAYAGGGKGGGGGNIYGVKKLKMSSGKKGGAKMRTGSKMKGSGNQMFGGLKANPFGSSKMQKIKKQKSTVNVSPGSAGSGPQRNEARPDKFHQEGGDFFSTF